MIFTGDNYEPSSLESDIFLSDIPVSLIKENIKEQFKDPLESGNDYVTIFLDKYEYSKECCDEENLPQLRTIRDDFMEFMKERFRKKLGLGFPDFEIMDEEEQNDCVKNVYIFFVLNIKKNFTNLILNYIDEHRRTVAELSSKKKDVTSLSFKKEIQNPDDIAILSNLADVIDFIMDEELDVDTFMRLVQPNDFYFESVYLNDAYDNAKVTGNFVPKYRKMIDAEFKRDIETKVRNKIISRAKK